MKVEYTTEQIQRSFRLLSMEEMFLTHEFSGFMSLLSRSGRGIGEIIGGKVIALDVPEFQTVDEKIGLSFFVSLCFEKPMSLRSITLVDSERARICFLTTDGSLVGFWGEKFVTDPEGREVYYADIVGSVPKFRAGGLTSAMGKTCLDDYRKQLSRKSDVAVLTRTQNPLMVGALRRALPEGTALFPFDARPSENWILTVNWLVASGFISRNTRSDTFFDARKSLVHFGAYGLYGDGSTWENMIKEYPDIDWSKTTAKQMLCYLEQNGLTLDECLSKGHAFIVGADLLGTKV